MDAEERERLVEAEAEELIGATRLPASPNTSGWSKMMNSAMRGERHRGQREIQTLEPERRERHEHPERHRDHAPRRADPTDCR